MCTQLHLQLVLRWWCGGQLFVFKTTFVWSAWQQSLFWADISVSSGGGHGPRFHSRRGQEFSAYRHVPTTTSSPQGIGNFFPGWGVGGGRAWGLPPTSANLQNFSDRRYLCRLTHTHTHTHTLSLSHSHTHSLSHSITHKHTHILSLSHSLTYIHTHTHTHSLTQSHTQTRTCRHSSNLLVPFLCFTDRASQYIYLSN